MASFKHGPGVYVNFETALPPAPNHVHSMTSWGSDYAVTYPQPVTHQHVAEYVGPNGVIYPSPGPVLGTSQATFGSPGHTHPSYPPPKAEQLSLEAAADPVEHAQSVMLYGLKQLMKDCAGKPVGNELFGFMHGTITALSHRANLIDVEVKQEQYDLQTRLVVTGRLPSKVEYLHFSIDVN